ncbi:MAG: RagB/SusD family nutrient uptake outer membrane protein [Chitinophagaceae bacterium]
MLKLSKMKLRWIYIMIIIGTSCGKDYLNVLPEDVITTPIFWQTKRDIDMGLSGCYTVLRDSYIYGLGPTLFDVTPDGNPIFSPAEESIANGAVDPGLGGLLGERWTSCYTMIYRTNYFLENYGRVKNLSQNEMATYKGQAYFLRGIAYSLLASTYGGGPVLTKTITPEEAKSIKRASLEETWNRAVSDFDTAIVNLGITTPDIGRATKGAALGMKMRALLYQNKYSEVLKTIGEIEKLNIYALFPSYEGLFKQANENNKEVLFDVQNIGGPNNLGGRRFNYLLPDFGGAGGCLSAPTGNLVSQYEMANGGLIDPANPYQGRDPRLNFTVILPGTPIGSYIFGTTAKPHVAQQVSEFGVRKYSDILVNGTAPQPDQAALNFIVLRYADVILAKAESLIETDQDINNAILLINMIRTGRNDVKIKPLPMNLIKTEARAALRHERRVEFACEGTIYWEDIRRWEIGPQIYPIDIYDGHGHVFLTRYKNKYTVAKDKYLPIPGTEIALNPNLVQNPGW